MTIRHTVLITTSTFGVYDQGPIETLKKSGLIPILNPNNRKLNYQESINLIVKHRPIGMVAGTEKIDRSLLEKSVSFLKIISRVGTGVENIDTDAAQELGILVYRTPDAPTNAVGELTIGLMLDVFRKISLADRKIRNLDWSPLMGNLLSSKTVGIVGWGRVGKFVANILANGFDSKIIFFDPFLSENEPKDSPFHMVDRLESLLSESDIVSLHVSGGQNSRHLIGHNELGLMKESSIIINTSRGSVIEENALISALQSGKIGGAGLDVFENEPYTGPLLGFDNVVLTMHMGSYARETRIRMEMEAVSNLISGLEREG